MAIPKDLLREHKGLGAWSILTAYRGSITHGTYRPNSESDSIDDKDVMAICVPPLDYFFGLKQFHSRGTQEIKRDEWDIVVYEVRKFLRLLAKGNPNVLMLLWLEENHYIKVTEAGQRILDNRDLFVGKHVYHPFSGYAHAQLHRMTSGAHEGYMGEKRKRLVKQFGYDTKNGSHLIRLLRMGIEFLTDGALHVQRPDAAELLDIKRGAWSLERVKTEAERLFRLAEEAHVRSPLPEKPDKEAINALAVEVVQIAIRGH